jgi:alpha-N-arabinofuranosidase
LYLKLVNASSVPQPIEINLPGTISVDETATLISLSGNNPAETNTISAPARIVPVRTTLTNAGVKFSHAIPAYSIQVIQLRAK